MNKKLYVFLMVVVGFNTLRYGSYLVEGSESVYHMVFFSLNLLCLLYGFSRAKAFNHTDQAKS